MNIQDEKNIKTIDTFFPSGLMYTSEIFNGNTLVKFLRYFSNGNLSQIIEFENGKIISKCNYDRLGNIYETVTYTYYEYNEIASIISEKPHIIRSVTFFREESTHRISNIRIRVNNILIRNIDYEYLAPNKIECHEQNQEETKNYILNALPSADESWFVQPNPSSLVMRKLNTALVLSI